MSGPDLGAQEPRACGREGGAERGERAREESVHERRGFWNVRVRGPRAPPARPPIGPGEARRGNLWLISLPLNRVDVGAGPQSPRAEEQIVPAAVPRAPPRFCWPRPSCPEGAGNPRGGRGRPPRAPSTPAPSSPSDRWIALPPGKVIGFRAPSSRDQRKSEAEAEPEVGGAGG